MASKVCASILASAREALASKREGCLVRKKCVLDTGYTLIHFNKKHAIRAVLTHRFVFENLFGPIPEGISILHSCDNPPCFNPMHLFSGTPLDNSTDMVAKDRHACGIRNTQSKISEADVAEIRRLFASGVYQRIIGKRFGLAQCTISEIVHRKIWAHIP